MGLVQEWRKCLVIRPVDRAQRGAAADMDMDMDDSTFMGIDMSRSGSGMIVSCCKQID